MRLVNISKYFLFAMFLNFVLFFVACGVTETESENDLGEDTIPTLTILTPGIYESVIRETERRMRLSGEANINIELTAYGIGESFNQQMRLETMLMAGQSYDLVFWNFHPSRTYAASGFLTNFYDLMDNENSYFSREDFYAHVLAAYEQDGSLYVFPITFGFEYIGINETLPQSIIDQFLWRESITINDMVRLYIEMQNSYGEEFNHLDLGNALYLQSASSMLHAISSNFIDFDNSISHLNSRQFIGLLEEWRVVFSGHDIFTSYRNTMWSNVPTRDFLASSTTRHAFLSLNNSFNPANALFEAEEPSYFLNFIPLADEQGRLLINPLHTEGSTWAQVMIPTTENGSLAWQFVCYLIPTMLNYSPQSHSPPYALIGVNSLVSPIVRESFEPHITRVMATLLNGHYDELQSFRDVYGGANENAINEAVARLAKYNEMPVAVIENILPGAIVDVFLNELLMELVTPTEAAQEMHSRASLWLMGG